jgi:glycolate oxidase FAD binding subunit
MPQARDEAEVAEIIASTHYALEPVAGGSKRSIGRPVHAETLDLAPLRGILEYEPEELVLTARAATPLAEVEATLRERGQRLAFEPPDWSALLGSDGMPGRPTLGGVIAANASGSRRLTAGAARDHFLGLRAVSGRGERFKAGGRVVKNVTGYDLPKLLAGSWGTLAILTEVTVRVHPLPERERTLVVPLADAASAVRAMSAALGSTCEVSSAAFAPLIGVALRLEGFEPSVRARSQMLCEVLTDASAAADHRWLEDEDSRRWWRAIGAVHSLARHPVVWRLSTAPSEAPRIIEQLEPQDYLLDWGGGLIWIGAASADAGRVRGALASGHATLFKAPREVRAATAVFEPLPAPLAALTARLKAAFDPNDRLNPGRMS